VSHRPGSYYVLEQKRLGTEEPPLSIVFSKMDIASNCGISEASQSSDKCSLAAPQTKKQKATHLKGVCGYGGSSCSPPGKSANSVTSLKCLYTNTHSMGDKQEVLEICMQSQGHDLIAVTETWWDSSQDWNAVIDGYTLVRKGRPKSEVAELLFM